MQQNSTWEEDEEETMINRLPLHLAERNFLSHQSAFKTTDRTRDAIVMFTKKEKDTVKDMVIFPSSQKLEAIEKSRECIKDEKPDTLKALQKIKRQAIAQAKREASINKSISGKQKQNNTHGEDEIKSTVKTDSLPEITGYLDTYNWDHYHNLDPHFTFSQTRHNRRMARLAEMAEFSVALPLSDISIPLQMDADELFDQSNDSENT